MTIQYSGTDFESDYEGDHPWFAVEFRDPPSGSARKKIEAFVLELFFTALSWSDENPNACTIECELDRSELQDWDRHREAFHEMIKALHTTFPIQSVGFQDASDVLGG